MRYLKCIAPCRWFTAGELYPIIKDLPDRYTLIDDTGEWHIMSKDTMFTQTSFTREKGEEEQS
ncbi:hypothetical protein [Paenibacillus xylanexedens]|uniref:hypothetical protein n=1 Tax=Paenibacillus xylanexedens TaxID=528191 RepID=UPI0011A7D140|nr:hypothetical protein [Paenibacillus xylanexedens]